MQEAKFCEAFAIDGNQVQTVSKTEAIDSTKPCRQWQIAPRGTKGFLQFAASSEFGSSIQRITIRIPRSFASLCGFVHPQRAPVRPESACTMCLSRKRHSRASPTTCRLSIRRASVVPSDGRCTGSKSHCREVPSSQRMAEGRAPVVARHSCHHQPGCPRKSAKKDQRVNSEALPRRF